MKKRTMIALFLVSRQVFAILINSAIRRRVCVSRRKKQGPKHQRSSDASRITHLFWSRVSRFFPVSFERQERISSGKWGRLRKLGSFDRGRKEKLVSADHRMNAIGKLHNRSRSTRARLLQPSHPWTKPQGGLIARSCSLREPRDEPISMAWALASIGKKKKKKKKQKKRTRRLAVDQENATPRVNAIHLDDLRFPSSSSAMHFS